MGAQDHDMAAVRGEGGMPPPTSEQVLAQAQPQPETKQGDSSHGSTRPDITANTGVNTGVANTGTDDAHADAAAAAPVDDLHFIQGLVDSGAVVGSMPAVDMPAAEKRRMVEAQMAASGAQAPSGGESATGAAPSGAGATVAPAESDSSSEFESSDDERAVKAPPSPGTQAAMRSELDRFVGRAGDDDDSDSDSDGDGDSSVDLGSKLGAFGLELVDSDDEGGGGGLPAITSVHEQPLPPVSLPPLERVDGELRLAGDVVSWMKERGVEAWLATQADQSGQVKNEPAADVDMATEHAQEAKPDIEPHVKQEDVAMDESKPPTDTMAESKPTSEDKPQPASDDKPATGDVDMAEAPKPDAEPDAAAPASASGSASTSATPKFPSSGTVIIRAMQEPGTGWLEEGSVLCFADGRVLGCVADTFGPLTSPFYLVRLPPPPFPYPNADELAPGSRVFYPAEPRYRTYVDMHAVRDPRFRSDASNVYDEEVGDDEVEWSDDEAEMAAKRRRKKGKGRGGGAGAAGAGGSAGRGGRGGSGPHGLPPRPHAHFDHDPNPPVGPGGRPLVAYDDDLGGAGSAPRRGGGRGGRGRGQGRPTGHGRPQHALPPRPPQPHAYAHGGGDPGMYPAQGMGMGMPGAAPGGFGAQGGYPGGYPGYGYAPQGGYAAPAGGYPPQGMPMPMGYGGMTPAPHPGAGAPNPPAGAGGNAPAINPLFAAQLMGGYWPQQGQAPPGGHGGQQGGHGGQQGGQHGGHGGYSE